MTLHMHWDQAQRSQSDLLRSYLGSRSFRATRIRVGICAAALLFLGIGTPLSAQGSVPVEYQVKAAFLLNFARFVEWPSDAFQSEKDPLVICMFKHDPFGSALDEIIHGKTINNHEVRARRINELPELKPCQLVFISEADDKRLPDVLNSLKGASVLVVGESNGFVERGGGIQFYLEDKTLRFAVNLDAIARARLSVSSKLLALARIVHDPGRPKGN